MTAVFTKHKGVWRFFGAFKSKESLESELKFLDDAFTMHKEIPIQSLDFKQISMLEDSLNQE